MKTLLKSALSMVALMPMLSYGSELVRVEIAKAGELSDLLGDQANLIDSISVSGPINEDDFKTLWDCSRFGELVYIDLQHTQVPDNEIPPMCFWEGDNPFVYDHEFIEPKLRHIILPENLEKVGRQAFKCCYNLEKVGFPQTLKVLDGETFCYCSSLQGANCILPSSLEVIDGGDFGGCYNLESIEIPASVRIIGPYAFWESYINEIVLHEGVEEIGLMAFSNCNIESITIPGTCLELGGYVFFESRKLKKITLPEGLLEIPEGFVWECQSLVDINIPSTIKKIGDNGLHYARLNEVVLPEGLESVGECGLPGGSFSSIMLPESLIAIGAESCVWGQLTSFYSKSSIPPVCEFKTRTFFIPQDDPALFPQMVNVECGPFGPMDLEIEAVRTPRDIPVYVPVGSKQAYQNAPGWNYFTNFIEIENFPEPSALGFTTVDSYDESKCYNLTGLPVVSPIKGRVYIKNNKKVLF